MSSRVHPEPAGRVSELENDYNQSNNNIESSISQENQPFQDCSNSLQENCPQGEYHNGETNIEESKREFLQEGSQNQSRSINKAEGQQYKHRLFFKCLKKPSTSLITAFIILFLPFVITN